MSKEKVIRPEAAEVKAMIAEATRIDAGLLEIQDSEKNQRRAAQQAAQALYDDRIRSVLTEMDVEHINRANMGQTDTMELNAVSIGTQFALVTAPCELFDGISSETEAAASFDTVFTLGYTNGYYGYIPTAFGLNIPAMNPMYAGLSPVSVKPSGTPLLIC